MSEYSLVIRLCEPDDTPKIVPMLQAQVAASGREAPDPDALADLVHALLATQFSDFLLAELNDRPLGVMQINYRLSTWEVAPYAAIEDFYLAPELRGRGAGIRMLDYACARAEARGSKFIQTLARPEDKAARRVYEALGFSAAPQSLWRSELPLSCAMPTDEPPAHERAETSN
ncbi:MAG: GNAT family N-acetyltransferase [Kouleothrix sp.]|nr:GNAT family N-acetyltransferase [Kouleothrix sp.]